MNHCIKTKEQNPLFYVFLKNSGEVSSRIAGPETSHYDNDALFPHNPQSATLHLPAARAGVEDEAHTGRHCLARH